MLCGPELEESTMPDVAFLKVFADAWNRNDVDAIMASMTEDCVFITSGDDRFEGQAAVREIFDDIVGSFSELTFKNARHFADGDRGLSE
jgi:ketosteroid isomerase-like protein